MPSLFFRNAPVNGKHIGGYVIEIPIIIRNVLGYVLPNPVLKLMNKFTTFVGLTNYKTTFLNFELKMQKRFEKQFKTESKTPCP